MISPSFGSPGNADQFRDKLPPDVFERPIIFTAVREQLGLKLTAQKGPVTYFVVDHIEHPPKTKVTKVSKRILSATLNASDALPGLQRPADLRAGIFCFNAPRTSPCEVT